MDKKITNEFTILCPKCYTKLEIKEKIFCKNCVEEFPHQNNIIDLTVDEAEKNTSTEIDILLKEIKKNGYEFGIKKFLKIFPKYKTQLINTEFNQSIDHIVYCLSKENKRCLILENEYGNTVETLSNIYLQIVSQNSKKKFLEFQSKRFKQISKDNVILIHSNLNKLLFPSDYFDLIVFGDLFDKLKKNQTPMFIREVSRVLKPGGCFYFEDDNLNEWIKPVLLDSDLHIKQYWSAQTSQIPSFSGKLNDDVGLKWYMNNISNFITTKEIGMKKKIALWSLQKNSKLTIKIFKKKFIQRVIFCCYKYNFPTSIVDFIEKETGYKHYVIQSRPKKIVGVLLDDHCIPQKIFSFNRYGTDFPSKIAVAERKFPKMTNPKERIWMEDWFHGRPMNLNNFLDVSLALDWLIKFQTDTRQEKIEHEKIRFEVSKTSTDIEKNPLLNNFQCNNWLNDYRLFLEKNSFYFTATHGDFWINNILVNPQTSKIHVIDWEKYQSKGFPFYDFMYFFIRLMTKTKRSSLDVKKFERFINENTHEYNELVKLKKKIDFHFNCNFDFLTLLRITIIKRILEPPYGSSIASKKDDSLQLEMLRMLSKKEALFV